MAVVVAAASGGVPTVAVAQVPAPAGVTSESAAPRAEDSVRSPNKYLALREDLAFLVLLSAFDRAAYPNEMANGKRVFASTFASTWDHLSDQAWVHDPDPFNVNQFGHPYEGATLYGLARASEHSFWQSLVYSNVGSFTWEMAGETTSPSINDLITTGQAGTLLGEALFRMANLAVRANGDKKPGFWRELAATAISPPTGVNRRILGDRYVASLSDTTPATFWQVRVGANKDAVAQDYSNPGTLLQRDATTDFQMSYGSPGVPGFEYTRPLDYFDFEFSLLSNTANPIENVLLRGLLIGRKTANEGSTRGIWGLYGTYDYISPYLFRVSSTALSIGTTQQAWLTDAIALQGTALAGVGYGAAGSTEVASSTVPNEVIRDYHLGVTPQALLTSRLIVGHRLMLDVKAREYYVSGLGSDDVGGSETIFRGTFGATLRVIGSNALGVQYVASSRNAHYGKQPDRKFTEGTVTVTYSFLGGNTFGAVKW